MLIPRLTLAVLPGDDDVPVLGQFARGCPGQLDHVMLSGSGHLGQGVNSGMDALQLRQPLDLRRRAVGELDDGIVGIQLDDRDRPVGVRDGLDDCRVVMLLDNLQSYVHVSELNE